jgi:hypothetical protein
MMLSIIDLLSATQGVTRYMRSGSPARDGRGWSAQQHPYQDYGPEVSWPNGFRRVEKDSGEYPQFDTGEYQRLVESSYRSGEYDHVDPRRGTRGYQQPAIEDYGYGDPGYADPSYDGPRGNGAPGYRQADVYPVTGAQQALPDYPPAYPVTGAQEVLRDYPAYPVTGAQEALPPGYPAPGGQPPAARRADPRLDGLRYDEIRYDDAPPRYHDDPLTDEAWYAELRRSNGQAQPPAGPAVHPAAPPRGAGPRPGPPMDTPPRIAGPGPSGGPSYPRAAATLPGRPPQAPPAPPRGYAQGAPRPGFLGAPTGQVGLLTPPGGTSFGEPGRRQMSTAVSTDTVAWTMRPDADEQDAFDEFWQEDDGEGLLDAPGGRAITRTRETSSRPAPTGRRRGRSGDRRLWVSLGVIGVVAAGAIVGILKFEFPGGGASHSVVTPAALGTYQWAPTLEKNADFQDLKGTVARMTGGQATSMVAREYEKASTGGAAPQLLDVFGAHLPNTSPASSIAALTQKYPSAQVVSAGPMGGDAACFEQEMGTPDSRAVCVWFDDDSMGVLVSPTMSAADLANLMLKDRPQIELVKN